MKQPTEKQLPQPTLTEIANAYTIYKNVYGTMIDNTISFELFMQKVLLSFEMKGHN